MSLQLTESWSVEIYIPKKLEHLSELYNYLRTKLTDRRAGRQQEVPIDGFSLYEVDGAFLGERLYEERTVVVRILFVKNEVDTPDVIRTRLLALGAEIAGKVALTEEEIWICHAPLVVGIFRPATAESAPSKRK